MATHSSVLAWRIPGMGKPGGLPSMGPHRVGHDWRDLAAAAAHIFTWISHGCTCVPHPEPPFHLLPHRIRLGCPWAPALSALLHASNLHWSSILHMVIYIFQCYSLKLSHPHLLPHSPKVCSLHLCLFCCLAYRIFVTIFLNSILWVSILYWCFSFLLHSV